MIDDAAAELLSEQDKGVLVTLRRDGRPQLSNIVYGFDPTSGVIRVSTTADRAKVKNLRHDPRASLYVTTPDFWSYVVADGTADLSPVATSPDDATVDELVGLYRAISGEHPDWDDYRKAMVADGRLVVRLHVESTYGQLPGR
jgi:PPOX class probable F420-dependent enzyme